MPSKGEYLLPTTGKTWNAISQEHFGDFEMRGAKLSVEETEVFIDPSFSKRFCENANNLRQQNILTDAILDVEGKLFPVHRFVLAANSDYFMKMFHGPLANNSGYTTLAGISASNMDEILAYLYSGQISISESNIQDLLEAAAFFLLVNLRDRCVKFLRDRLDEANCLNVYCLSKQLSLTSLAKYSLQMIASQYKTVSIHEDFAALPADILIDILASDKLAAPSESFIFLSVLNWFKSGTHHTGLQLADVLGYVHLSFVDEDLLTEETKDMAVAHIVEAAINKESMSTSWAWTRRCQENVRTIVVEGGTSLMVLSPNTNEWITLSNSKPKHCPGMAVIGRNIYIAGGSLKWKRKSCGERFEVTTGEWHEISSMDTPRSNFGLVELQGRLFALGGYDGETPIKKFESYDPTADKWTSLPDLQYARDGSCDVTDGERVYSLGGYDGNRYLDSAEIYDTETNTWDSTKIPALRVLRQNAMAVHHEGRIYLMGGYCNDEFHTSVEILDLQSMRWSAGAPMPTPRHYAGASVIDGRIFICGGWTSHRPVCDVNVYSIADDTWSSTTSLPSPTMIRCSEIDFPRSLLSKIDVQQLLEE